MLVSAEIAARRIGRATEHDRADVTLLASGFASRNTILTSDEWQRDLVLISAMRLVPLNRTNPCGRAASNSWTSSFQ
jgi:hypothetical protein